MLKTEEYYQSLVLDYLAGDLNEKGKKELWEWLQAEEHVLLFRQWLKVYYSAQAAGQWQSVDGEMARQSVFARLQTENVGRAPFRRSHSSRLLRIRMFTYAACAACVLLAVALVWLDQGIHFRPEKGAGKYATHIQSPGKRDVVLVIGGEEEWILSDRESLLIPSATGKSIRISDNGLIDYSELLQKKNERTAPQHTLKIPRGSEFCITLSDGTRVWLNAMSELSYPEYFSGEKREVTLSGEAYFEVSPNPKAPFIVHTAEMNLEVLGTSFNIRTYSEENRLTTTLTSGKIRQHYPATGDTLILSPNEQAIYDKQQQHLQIQKADLAAVMAWKEGRILVRDGTLEEIFQELSRWYDFKISYQQESLKRMRFYLNIDRYANVESVLEKLQRTRGIRFIIQGKEILVCNDVNQ